MRGIILFQSKYGATEKYANWLAERTGYTLLETKQANIKTVQTYDTVILGGGIYASGIAGLSFLKKHITALRGKNLFVFCVGASPFDAAAFDEIVKHNLVDTLADIPCYYCRGTWNPDAMHVIDRSLCKLLHRAVQKKNPAEYAPWEKALIEAGDDNCDWTDPAYLSPLLDTLQSCLQPKDFDPIKRPELAYKHHTVAAEKREN